jgi:hypothetical protein
MEWVLKLLKKAIGTDLARAWPLLRNGPRVSLCRNCCNSTTHDDDSFLDDGRGRSGGGGGCIVPRKKVATIAAVATPQ